MPIKIPFLAYQFLIFISSTVSVLKLHEKGLITKEHIQVVTDTNSTFAFKWAVHFSTFSNKIF